MKINKLLTYLLLSQVLLLGCSQMPKKSDEYTTVSALNKTYENRKPKIRSGIDHFDSNRYGPQSNTGSQSSQGSKSEVRDPIIGLVLGPGLYRSVAHISFLRAIEKSNITIHAVSGIGFGSIIASLYASGRTPDEIEWRFFKFFSKSKNTEPFTEKWFENLEEGLIKELKGKRLQEMKKSLVLLNPNSRRDSIKLIKSGDLYKSILENVKIVRTRPAGDFFLGRNEGKNHYMMRELGVDILLIVDALGDEIKITSNDDYLMGQFGKISSQISQKQGLYRYFFELPTQEMAIDSTNELTLVMKQSYEKSFSYAEEILNTIKEWKNNKNKH